MISTLNKTEMKVKLTDKSEATSMLIPPNKLDRMVYSSVQGPKRKSIQK